MMGLYNVGTCGRHPAALTPGFVRKYFIAAEKVMWNYAPDNYDRFTHKALDDPDR